jgi:hypothetical protein
MDIDDRIARVKDLIQKREEIDTELAGLFGITGKAKKTLRCSKCGDEGHNAKTCPSQQHAEGESGLILAVRRPNSTLTLRAKFVRRAGYSVGIRYAPSYPYAHTS